MSIQNPETPAPRIRLKSRKWRVSRSNANNVWLSAGGYTAIVYRNRDGFGYTINEERAEQTFPSQEEACAAALTVIQERLDATDPAVARRNEKAAAARRFDKSRYRQMHHPAPTNQERARRIERQLRKRFQQRHAPLPDAEAALDRLLSGDGTAALELVRAFPGTAGWAVALAYLTGIVGTDLRAALEATEALRGRGAVAGALSNNPVQMQALRKRAGL